MVERHYQESSSLTATQKRARQDQFKVDVYNYYTSSNVTELPAQLRCMVTGQKLDRQDVTCGHLFGRSRKVVSTPVASCLCHLNVL